jgi:hypothetical protein
MRPPCVHVQAIQTGILELLERRPGFVSVDNPQIHCHVCSDVFVLASLYASPQVDSDGVVGRIWPKDYTELSRRLVEYMANTRVRGGLLPGLRELSQEELIDVLEDALHLEGVTIPGKTYYEKAT